MVMICDTIGLSMNSCVIELKRHTKRCNYLLLMALLTLTHFSCEELEPVNPADPAYTLHPPTLLSVDALTDTRMEISWKNNEEHTKEFVIQRKSGSESYGSIGTVVQNTLTFIDSACMLGTEYSYVVQSKVESNVSVNSNNLSKATTFPGPTNLNGIAISDESVRLTWTDACTFEIGYKIERNSGFGFEQIAEINSNVISYTDTGLIYGQNYNYRVAAYSSANTSLWAIITAATEFPAPSDLEAMSMSDSELLLTWTDNTGYEGGFKIERDSGSGFTETGTVSSDVTEFTDSGLTFGQDYNYRVAAYTSINTSSWAIITAATEFPAPSNLSASSVSDSELLLTWTDNTAYEAGFKIERDAGSGFSEIGTVLSDITEYRDTDLIYGQSYNYRVAALTSANTSSWATITAATAFPSPSNISANAISDSEIELTWTDNTAYEAGFKIERDVGSGFTEIGTVAEDVTEYTDTGLTYGQSYSYRVAAYTLANTSSWATITAATEFPPPSNLSASSVSDSDLLLTWTDNTGYEAGFKIERDAGSGFSEIGTVAEDVTEYTDTGLTYGQSYSYRVATFTASNMSSWAMATATTEFPAPSDLSATMISDSEIRLTWTDNTGYEMGFKIESDDGSGYVELGLVGSNVTDYIDSGLTSGQSYSYRVAAFTSANISNYSAAVTAIPYLEDIDGNAYQTVQIGDQKWMAENLKVTHYREGTAITHVTDNTSWGGLTTEAYCIYNNNASNEVDIYGALYNCYAVEDSRNIAPEGWHVPTDAEWTELETYLSNNGYSGIEGSALKSISGWNAGGNGTDEFGFTALPSGWRIQVDGYFSNVGVSAHYWSVSDAWYRMLYYNESNITRSSGNRRNGFSVRCVKD